MKTIKEWLNELPEPERSQAIENMQPDAEGQITARNKAEAVIQAFVFSQTPQGFSYWNNIHFNLEKEL